MLFRPLLIIATLVGSTLASPVDLPAPMGVTVKYQIEPCHTNAKCLAKGLPIRKPTPARRDRTLAPRTSPVPGEPARLKILLNGALYGYVNQNDGFFKTSNPGNALRVYAPTSALSFGDLIIAPVSRVDNGMFVAISPSRADDGETNMRSNSNNFGWIQQSPSSQTTPTAVNAKPYGTSFKVETVVWSYDPSSGSLLAGWRNTGADYDPTVLLYPFVAQNGGSMYWAGDPNGIDIDAGFDRVDVVLEAV